MGYGERGRNVNVRAVGGTTNVTVGKQINGRTNEGRAGVPASVNRWWRNQIRNDPPKAVNSGERQQWQHPVTAGGGGEIRAATIQRERGANKRNRQRGGVQAVATGRRVHQNERARQGRKCNATGRDGGIHSGTVSQT